MIFKGFQKTVKVPSLSKTRFRFFLLNREQIFSDGEFSRIHSPPSHVSNEPMEPILRMSQSSGCLAAPENNEGEASKKFTWGKKISSGKKISWDFFIHSTH